MTDHHDPTVINLDDVERTRRTQEAFTAAAHLLATQPDAVQPALIAHRRASDDRCYRCGPTTRWPCAVAAIAHQAAGLIPP